MPQLSLYRVTSGPINKISKISEALCLQITKTYLGIFFSRCRMVMGPGRMNINRPWDDNGATSRPCNDRGSYIGREEYGKTQRLRLNNLHFTIPGCI